MAECISTTGRNRAAVIRESLLTTVQDNSVLHLFGQTSDSFMNEGSLQLLPNVLALEAAQLVLPTIVYSLGQWVRPIVAEQGLAVARLPKLNPADPPTIHLEQIFEAMEKDGPCMLILDYCEALMPGQANSNPQEARSRFVEQVLDKAYSPEWRGHGHRIVLISRVETIDSSLRRMPGILNVSIQLPALDERMAAIERMLSDTRSPFICEEGLDVNRLARITGGLNLDEISRWRRRSSEAAPLTEDQIIEHKGNSVRDKAGNALSVADERLSMNSDIAGMENVKQYVREQVSLGASRVLMLLAGGPGTGKSTVATAIGEELGAVVLFLDQPKSKWVGETEDNMKRALEIAESMAPAVLVIDEADQTVFSSRKQSASEESSSVDSAARAILMQWMGDSAKDNGVSVVAMTNNPAGIDAAIIDRLEVMAVLEQSSPAGKARVLSLQARRLGVEIDTPGAEQAFRSRDVTFTGRQITRMLSSARILAQSRGDARVEEPDILAAIDDNIHHFGVTEMLASMRAVLYTSSRRYLPWVAAWAAGENEAAPPPYLTDFVNASGGIDTQALESEIRSLETGYVS